jgi:hypothetical protein
MKTSNLGYQYICGLMRVSLIDLSHYIESTDVDRYSFSFSVRSRCPLNESSGCCTQYEIFSCIKKKHTVNITKSYGPDNRGSIPRGGKTFFSTPQHPDRLWSPASYPLGTWNPFPGVKLPRLETDHSQNVKKIT